jgi:hypothetical protein
MLAIFSGLGKYFRMRRLGMPNSQSLTMGVRLFLIRYDLAIVFM